MLLQCKECLYWIPGDSNSMEHAEQVNGNGQNYGRCVHALPTGIQDDRRGRWIRTAENEGCSGGVLLTQASDFEKEVRQRLIEHYQERKAIQLAKLSKKGGGFSR